MSTVRWALKSEGESHEVSAVDSSIEERQVRAQEIFGEMQESIYKRTDGMFAGLMIFQWIAGIIAAMLISPRTWEGGASSTHIHVWVAILVGGANTLLPVTLIWLMPGKALTRHVIAICQMLTASLLVHLTGGRIETHFHFFGSLAFLAFYRDWRVLMTATLVTAAEHFIGGFYFPQSVYGVLAPEAWRWLEHAGWVAFEDFFLIVSIVQSLREMRGIAESQAGLETVNATIERKVETRTEELVHAREAALSASVAKTEFLSSMSHEIRTPMNAILGMTELLDETSLNLNQRKYLEVMRKNGDALLILINDILDLARIESGRLALEHGNFDLEELIDNALETLGLRAHEKGIELVARFAPDVPLRLVGDQLRLRQILINLVGNAIKFTEKGQVLVNVTRDRDSASAGSLHFSIADTGIGIAKETIPQIFSNFTQADSSTTRRYGGSGLGLAIVKRLTDLMGGKIWVESDLGCGSVFHFAVTLDVQATSKVEKLPAVAALLPGTRVLIVDDNATNRLILREMLSGRGAQVVEAEDGPSALEELQAASQSGNPFKLMLLDCRMPDMDGFEVAEQVRLKHNESLTVLMLSSDDLKIKLERARELGLDAYLVKPVRRAAVFEAISTAMERRERPHAPEPVPALPSVATSPELSGRQLRILVVDDSRDNRLVIKAYLKSTPALIEEAENGAFAVDKMKSDKYDVVLMDIQMPVMDGLEAIRCIRQWETESKVDRTAIIALTASALESDVRRSLEAGADMHLSKPIKKAVLLATLNAIPESKAVVTIASVA
jgi:signal transduction histidine kinase/CheY-like chemotaxis protein